jgi:hypothetical protein
MTVKRILLVVLVGVMLLAGGIGPDSAGSVQAEPLLLVADGADGTIPYAGTLTDAGGQPVPDGAYDFHFALYAAETGGQALWSEAQTGVRVRQGQFGTTLGRTNSIPATDGSEPWLAVEVRGPGDNGFTALTPRQHLSSTSSAALSSLTAGLACPHDHLGEIWSGWTGPNDGLWLKGNVNWSLGMLLVDNNGNGPAIWGYNNGGGNAVRGDGEGPGSLGVYGSSEQSTGVVGRSTNGRGVEGYTTVIGQYGVYGKNEATAAGGIGVVGYAPNGTGVLGQGPMFGLYARGDLRVEGYSIFDGGKSGYVVEVAQNDDSAPLEAGDVVVISGAGPAVVGEIPVVKVRLAAAGQMGAIVGVVDKHFNPTPEGKADYERSESVVDDAAIGPGDYLTIVTLGAYKAIKVDASYGAISPGDRLVASPNSGYAMRAVSPEPGTVLGKALGTLTSGTGVIPVMVTLQ